MKIPENKIFLKNVDLCRIAFQPQPGQIEQEVDCITKGICEHKYLEGYLHLRYPQLGELSFLAQIIRQICDNLLLKNYWAAVTLTNFLFEATFKYALIYLNAEQSAGQLDEIHVHSLKKYVNNDLITNINCCRSHNFITKEDTERLRTLAQRFRNPLSHADLSQVAQTSPCDCFKMYILPIGGVSNMVERDLKWKNTPIFQFHYTSKYIETNAENYFFTIMHYVDKLDWMITKKIEDEEKAHKSKI